MNRAAPRVDHVPRQARWAYTTWRYQMRKCRAEQRRVTEALAGHWHTHAVKAGKRMRRCCENFMAAINLKSAEVKACPMHCDVMVCPACVVHKHRTSIEKANFCIAKTMAEGDRLRHIVLTMPRQRGDVRRLAEKAAGYYERLTRRSAWKHRCRGWMAAFEVTGNARVGWLWHVHILAVGRYWRNQCKMATADGELRPAHPDECECVRRYNVNEAGRVVDVENNDADQNMVPGRKNHPRNRCLMQEWHQCTDGLARIVHISSAGFHHRQAGLVQGDDGERRGDAIAEAIKYVIKTQELDADGLADFVIGMRHFQRIRWGGEWRGMKPDDPAEHVPQAIIDPADLLALATGTIGPLLVPMTRSPYAVAAAESAGWSVHFVHGPPMEGRKRPPPMVLLDQEAATAIASNLDKHTDEIQRRTDKYERENPTARMGFDTHVPF